MFCTYFYFILFLGDRYERWKNPENARYSLWEGIEATIELEEEKYNREMASLKEENKKEMEKLKQEQKIKWKDLKAGLNLK